MQIRCPKHEDNVASCKVYADGAYCFAGCGFIPLEELGIPKSEVPEEKYVEDLKERLTYIKGLPVDVYRGFPLPHDLDGYYIIWPDNSYYKLRLNTSAKSKYRMPAGHKANLFWTRKQHRPVVCVVEGEFEAMSVAAAIPEWDVVSPGGVSNFKNKENLTQFLKYSKIIIATDDDAPGIKAAMEISQVLTYKVAYVTRIYKKAEKDFNDIYCQDGKDALREEIKRQVPEMFTEVRTG
jgi:5S rRNA maturation endonuclease (ribonuclease M5)